MTDHWGRTVATAEGDLRDKEGRLYAHATTTCMIFPARAPDRSMEGTIR
jgi:acyl-coenzyme A thioesterase PaaI-like protein